MVYYYMGGGIIISNFIFFCFCISFVFKTADTENIEYRQLWCFSGVLSTCDQNVNRTKHLTICAAQSTDSSLNF